jgi:copper chaperone CopZ
MKQTFTIKGTHCPACKKLIEKRVGTITGVSLVEVNFTTGETVITASHEITKGKLQKVLEGMDYQVV